MMFGFSVNILLEHYRMYVYNLFRGPPPQDTLINIVFFFKKKNTKNKTTVVVSFSFTLIHWKMILKSADAWRSPVSRYGGFLTAEEIRCWRTECG